MQIHHVGVFIREKNLLTNLIELYYPKDYCSSVIYALHYNLPRSSSYDFYQLICTLTGIHTPLPPTDTLFHNIFIFRMITFIIFLGIVFAITFVILKSSKNKNNGNGKALSGMPGAISVPLLGTTYMFLFDDLPGKS